MKFSIFYLLTVICLLGFSCTKELIDIEPDGYFTDTRDSLEYPFVEIGNQTWMMRNLAYESPEGAYVWEENQKLIADYGRLYSFEAALKACPAGWHLPTDLEWKILEKHLGMDPASADSVDWRRSADVAIALKNESGWYSGGNGNNNSKFSALPGGFRGTNGRYYYHGDIANYWTSNYTSETHAWGRAMIYYESGVYRWRYEKEEAFSVRCVKNL